MFSEWKLDPRLRRDDKCSTKNLLLRGDFLQGKHFGGVGVILYEADLSEEGEDDQWHECEEKCQCDFFSLSLRRWRLACWGFATAATFMTACGSLCPFFHLFIHTTYLNELTRRQKTGAVFRPHPFLPSNNPSIPQKNMRVNIPTKDENLYTETICTMCVFGNDGV